MTEIKPNKSFIVIVRHPSGENQDGKPMRDIALEIGDLIIDSLLDDTSRTISLPDTVYVTPDGVVTNLYSWSIEVIQVNGQGSVSCQKLEPPDQVSVPPADEASLQI